MMFDLSLSETAGSRSLNRLVELSRCAANTLQHRTAYAIPISYGRNTGLQISDQAASVVADCFMLDVFREMW